ncbi:site-specific integrase [Alcaligenes faecalis]|nr:site-specific integrase [Alcaligenes faecalis]
MLTDAKLRSLKPQEKPYKVVDRDGLYIMVLSSGSISFRYNYRINGRQETLVLGKYGAAGGCISLSEARELLTKAKKTLAAGTSPARQKARVKQRMGEMGTFGAWAKRWLEEYAMAESTRDMRRSVYLRELEPKFGRLKMPEITPEDIRILCGEIVDRGAPATAVHVREIVMLVFRFAIERGYSGKNPATEIRPSSIATFAPRSRSLSPEEVGMMCRYLDRVVAGPQFKVATRLLLLTMVRKSELTKATWSEISFTNALWTIPGERMKRRNPHVVYLSKQALEYFVALKTFAGGSEYVLPSRYDTDTPMSSATLNRVLTQVYELAQKDGQPLGKFGPHDLRRTASTLLHEAGYNTDWIEKCLAHEQKGVRAVYNKAEYREQRTAMLQDWADMIDRWEATPVDETVQRSYETALLVE